MKPNCFFQRSSVYESKLLLENKYKKTTCKFCEFDIISKHFARHLQRKHADEREVIEIFATNVKSTERKKLLSLLRNEGNLDSAIRGQIKPKKWLKGAEISEHDYAICIHCKAYYKRLSLSRHIKKCFAKKVNESVSKANVQGSLIQSVVYSACNRKYGDLLNKMAVKNEIFSKMRPDSITSTAISDIIIIHYGEDLLKKNKKKRSLYHISNKLRECGRFLLEMRNIGNYTDILSTLTPESFDDAIEATKRISKYDCEKRGFGAPSFALHFGTTLKDLSDLTNKLTLRNKIPISSHDTEKKLIELKRFKKIVSSQWSTEIGSLALKDLNEKAASKPKLLPFTEDIIKLKKFVEQIAEDCYAQLQNTKSEELFRTLAETTLVLTILHNRKRVGDIQYLEWETYRQQTHQTVSSIQTELATSLTENEKFLTKQYKRIISIGKGSRPVTILMPKNIQKYFAIISALRQNSTWFSAENTYLFTYPYSTKWINGCAVIRKYAKRCKAKYPELLTSCRLRKHIATVTQVLSLKGNEIDQLAKFMGHTTKTHEAFYK